MSECLVYWLTQYLTKKTWRSKAHLKIGISGCVVHYSVLWNVVIEDADNKDADNEEEDKDNNFKEGKTNEDNVSEVNIHEEEEKMYRVSLKKVI